MHLQNNCHCQYSLSRDIIIANTQGGNSSALSTKYQKCKLVHSSAANIGDAGNVNNSNNCAAKVAEFSESGCSEQQRPTLGLTHL